MAAAATAAAAVAAVPRTGALLLSSTIRTTTVAGRRTTISTVGPTIPSIFKPNPKKNGGFLVLFPSSTRRYCSSSSSSPQLSAQPVEAAAGEEERAPPPTAAADPKDPIKEAAEALDIRVGRILKAWRHPEADSLYVEEVDVGEAEPRTICSGLVNYIPLDHLQDTNVVVLANLKPRNMRGIRSNGMLMAASDASHETVELLKPPEDSIPGERIWFGSEEEKDHQPDAATPNQVQKKKIWESVQPHLKTTDTCVAVLGKYPMQTSAGVVKSPTLKNANIS